MKYIEYNREERNVCTHLFRVLHDEKKDHKILRDFLGDYSEFSDFNIFTEVALLRDAYYYRKKNDDNVLRFLDQIVKKIIEQEKKSNCRLYSELNSELRDPLKTHPKQIRQKASSLNLSLNTDEKEVYGSLQGMFNAKPDIAIFTDDIMLVYEAKLSLSFDYEQISRTNNIVNIWAEILYNDLGYNKKPKYKTLKLGLEKYKPDISWEKIIEILSDNLPSHDKSLNSIKMAVQACC